MWFIQPWFCVQVQGQGYSVSPCPRPRVPWLFFVRRFSSYIFRPCFFVRRFSFRHFFRPAFFRRESWKGGRKKWLDEKLRGRKTVLTKIYTNEIFDEKTPRRKIVLTQDKGFGASTQNGIVENWDVEWRVSMAFDIWQHSTWVFQSLICMKF